MHWLFLSDWNWLFLPDSEWSIPPDSNNGRKKTLFCVAVNLLELDDLGNIISELDENTSNLTLKEKSAHAASLLQEAAKKKNIILKLRKQKGSDKFS